MQTGRPRPPLPRWITLVLDDGRTTLEAAHWKTADGPSGCDSIGGVRRWTWQPAAGGLPALRADWLAAAQTIDEASHRHLIEGLLGYEKAEGHVRRARSGRPAAAGDAAELDCRHVALLRPCRLASAIGIRLFVERSAEPQYHCGHWRK